MADYHLNNDEIALELTKLYVEHYNRRVDQKYSSSHINEEHIGKAYQFFYNAVRFDIDLLGESKSTENNQ